MSNYQTLRAINVNAHTEKKNNLTYLSWAWAWDEFKNAYPDATYKILKSENGLPYFQSNAGVMVYTEVTAGGLTHEMWLPVMDGANNAMKAEAYTYTVWDKYKSKEIEKKVAAFDMFDVNKTIMRCLVKNLAMFGLGLYIYAGEDLPEEDKVKPTTVKATDGAMELLDEESQQFIKNFAMNIIADMQDGHIADAYGKLQTLDNDEKTAIWTLLDSKVRSALKKHADSLKG